MDTNTTPRHWLRGKYASLVEVAQRVLDGVRARGVHAHACIRGELDGGTISIFDHATRSVIRRYEVRSVPDGDGFRVSIEMTFTTGSAA